MRLYLRFFIKLASTICFIGYLPLMPGTFGSIAGLAIFFFAKGNILVYALGFTFLGFLASGRAENIFRKKDAGCIIIDEVSGMLLSLAFLPYDLRIAAAAFLLFRIFDILKPPPLRLLQDLKGSAGIMLDDVAAAVYTNIILQVFLRIISFKAS